MHSRRDFLRNAAALTGGALALGAIPDAVARAMSIDPVAGTTFRDAEHVVILMQENRSFDHAFGALQGVRGFRDPRAHRLPNGNAVWFQTDARGDTYAPFHLDIKATSATWIGGLPHTWPDQVDARAGGKYDKWLIAKPKRDLPFTLGHYARADIPFYYALADAFTVCDQAFCSSMTGTTPNRLFLWTGAIRKDAADFPRVQNADTVLDKEADWTTFPERLEDAGVSWRIYQNEMDIDSGLKGEELAWCGSFSDNPIEWFTQYHVRFGKSRRAYLPKFIAEAPARIAEMERVLATPDLGADVRARQQRQIDALRKQLESAQAERARYTDAAWDALPARAKSIHERAFTTNAGDPDYRGTAKLQYQDGGTPREVVVPAGDPLYQFRKDVDSGALPAVSWLVAPENFSDHPNAPWYGSWYVSEAMNILTKNPEVWKKTVFILCYDENDGYFDHVPPYVAPHPTRPETGAVSAGIDTAVEWANAHGRDHAIGLGYRVPMVIASPWSRGGCVNSQVFDHTSVIRFVETWLAGKRTQVRETNISAWRRTVCGDLTSAFREYNGEAIESPAALDRERTIEGIHAAKFRGAPAAGSPLTKDGIAATTMGAQQERGTRASCPLPYEFVVDARANSQTLELSMSAAGTVAGAPAQGAAFNAYSYGNEMRCRSYAVRAGDTLHDSFSIAGAYHVRVVGPNGFMREFRGDGSPNVVEAHVRPPKNRGVLGVDIELLNPTGAPHDVTLTDESYGSAVQQVHLPAGGTTNVAFDLAATKGWYDFTVRAGAMAYRYAGRVETGKWSITDPAMGA